MDYPGTVALQYERDLLWPAALMRCTRILKTYPFAFPRVLRRHLFAIALWCVPAFALNPDRNISQYAHTSWRMQEGIFSGRPSVITQTADGYLWIGTRAGLLRFDGARFVPWTPPEGRKLPSSDVRALLGARDGSLWIGTRNGLAQWKDGKLIDFPAVSGLIVDFFEDQQGAVWVARSGPNDRPGPLCRVSGTASRCFNASDGIPPEACCAESLAGDAQGNLWIGTPDLLLRWRPGSSTVFRPAALNSNNVAGVAALANAVDGSLWVGMALAGRGRGLQQFVNGVWKPFLTPQLDGSTLQVTELFADRKGALWIGTADQGILRVYGDRVDRYRSSDGLSSDFVTAFYEDREGSVWVVTPKGIEGFRDLRVASWSAREGLTLDNVVSVLAARDGTVWAGNAGGLDSIRNGKVSSIRTGKGLPGDQVTSLFEDHAHRLWVGVDSGLAVYEQGRFRKITRRNGSSTGLVAGMTEDIHNDIWAEVAGPRKLIRIHDFKVQEEFPAPATPSAHPLAADARGNLWLGLKTGDLGRFRNGQTQIVHFPRDTDSQVRQIMVNPDGSVLGATSFGVIAWREGKARTLTTRNGLPCDGINGLIADIRKNLWLHTACGLVEIENAEMQRWWTQPDTTIRFRSFDVLDGVQPGNSYFEPAARSTDGRLWFSNGSVLQMVDPDQLATNPIPPPVHVEDVVADRRHYSLQGAVTLPPLTRDLEIDYTALSFVAPQKVHFRYRLDGHDTDWQDSGTRRQAFYTDLAPGTYRFRVIACNNDGLWNESGATLSFSIARAFYQTLLFRIFCLIAVASILWLFYLAHLNRLTSRMQERLAARLEERERIARELHDTLLQGFQGLMLRFQSVLKDIPEREPARQMMESALDRADEVLLEGRERVRDLREVEITGGGLSDSLARCGKELAQDYATRFSLAIVGTPQPLDPTVCSEACRIGREALTNAFQHAHAEHIEVEITYDPARLRLIVRDDGVGMDNEILQGGRSGHWGLSGMRERAQKIGAQFNIWSHSRAGTEIDLIVPARVAYPRSRKESRWYWIKRSTTKRTG